MIQGDTNMTTPSEATAHVNRNPVGRAGNPVGRAGNPVSRAGIAALDNQRAAASRAYRAVSSYRLTPGTRLHRDPVSLVGRVGIEPTTN